MLETVRVRGELTAEDVRLGCRDDNMRCPYHRAISRLLTQLRVDFWWVEVGTNCVDIYTSPVTRVIIDSSWRVQRRIRRFDRTGRMRPEAFSLDLPASLLRGPLPSRKPKVVGVEPACEPALGVGTYAPAYALV